jgi:hypothetical protein
MRRSAKPTVQGIMAVELPSPDMAAVVTDRSLTGRELTGSSVSRVAQIAFAILGVSLGQYQ